MFKKVAVFLLLLILLLIHYRVFLVQKIIQGFSGNHFIVKPVSTKNSVDQKLASYQYSDKTVISVNNCQPTFAKKELNVANGGWQKLSNLDYLGRPQQANAMLNQKLMPPVQSQRARQRLTVKTPGYHAIKTGTHNTDWLYNRSHLIGYQFTGLNNDARNLITGTRQLNADSRKNAQSMLTYETEIADYLHESKNNYVRYQVTPVYRNVELVPRGIHMMAESIYDKNISFNIYIFNREDGWRINYLNGEAIAE